MYFTSMSVISMARFIHYIILCNYYIILQYEISYKYIIIALFSLSFTFILYFVSSAYVTTAILHFLCWPTMQHHKSSAHSWIEKYDHHVHDSYFSHAHIHKLTLMAVIRLATPETTLSSADTQVCAPRLEQVRGQVFAAGVCACLCYRCCNHYEPYLVHPWQLWTFVRCKSQGPRISILFDWYSYICPTLQLFIYFFFWLINMYMWRKASKLQIIYTLFIESFIMYLHNIKCRLPDISWITQRCSAKYVHVYIITIALHVLAQEWAYLS